MKRASDIAPHPGSALRAASILAVLAACTGGPSAQSTTPAPPPPAVDAAYVAAVDAYHASRIERLTAESGWLTLTGLDWLDRDGDFAIGSTDGLPVHLPRTAPADFGRLTRAGPQVTLTLAAGVAATANDRPITGPTELLPDQHADGPTVVKHGSVSFYVIDRDGRLGIRIKDSDAPARKAFSGVPRFPVDGAARVTARLQAHDEPTELEIPTVLGTVTREPTPGVLVFELAGQEYRLQPVGEPPDNLFLVFGDTTNGHTTYGGGRFLTTGELQPDGTVELDFNKAINPPCAFSEFATCPLPPRDNKLTAAVMAGEKVPEGAQGH